MIGYEKYFALVISRQKFNGHFENIFLKRNILGNIANTEIKQRYHNEGRVQIKNYKKLQDKSGINVRKNSRKRDEKDERSTC